MLCQDCRKREAQVHFTQIVNNEKTTLSICRECAAARGFHSPLENAPFPLAEILAGLAADLPTSPGSDDDPLVCPGCSLSFDDFASLGRFGCGECYRTFRTRLEPIMRKIHGASLHRGRTPKSEVTSTAEQGALPVREEGRLEAELKKAVESEDFERAAEIRDKLKTMRETTSVGN